MTEQIADYELLGKIDLVQVLERFESNLMKRFNCSKIGTISSFDASTQTATINIEGYPNIYKVPIMFPFGKDFSIQLPVNEGDNCIVLFCDTDLDNFKEDNGQKPAFSEDLHGLNGAVAFVGLTNSSTKITDYSKNCLRIKYKSSIIELNNNGISITGNVTVTGDVIADGISLKNHTHKYVKAVSADNLRSATVDTEVPTGE